MGKERKPSVGSTKSRETTRTLIAGAGGFLSSHLTDLLLKEGQEVIDVDNFQTGSKINLKKAHKTGQLEAIRHDINLPLYLEIDRICNLA